MRGGRLIAGVLTCGALVAAWVLLSRPAAAPVLEDALHEAGLGDPTATEAQLEGSVESTGMPVESGARPDKPATRAGTRGTAESAREAVSGRVVDENGKGVANAEVRTVRDSSGGRVTPGQPNIIAKCGPDGVFGMSVPKGWQGWVHVPVHVEHSRSARVALTGGRTNVELVVQRAPNLAGIVLDDRGVPIEGAQVTVAAALAPGSSADPFGPRPALASCVSNHKGEFAARIPPDRRGTVEVFAEPNGLQATSLLLEAGEPARVGQKNLVLRFVAAAHIQGRVEDVDGNPVEGVRVRLKRAINPYRGRSVIVGGAREWGIPSNRFLLGPMLPGSYELVAEVKSAVVGIPATVTVQAPAHDVVVVCPPFRGIRGRLVGSPGEDLSSFEVKWVATGHGDAPPVGTAPVNSRGLFHIALRGSPRCRLVARSSTDPRGAQTEGIGPSEEVLVLELGEGSVIIGKIVGGARRGDRDVFATQGETTVKIKSDREGAFRFTGLGRGMWRVHLRGMAGGRLRSRRASAVVAAGTTGVELAP